MNHKFAKSLIIQKIKLDENSNIKQSLNKIFNDPSYYFSDNLDGNMIIIGKKNPPKNKIQRNSLKRNSIFYYKNKNVIKIPQDKKKICLF